MEGDLNSTVPGDPVLDWLVAETNCSPHAARQAAEYVAAQQAAVAAVPTQTQVIFERFFDDSGGMQLVVHAPFGGRINRAWGLAMRKRFCRSFDFELQATADDDGFILSLGPQHSFPIESLFPMLRTDNVRNLLEQALLAVPVFKLRWRWNATRSLQIERMRNGKKVPPALQRFRSEDLLTAVFPKLTGCQEEHTGDHVIPDHPLVRQTMHDCLHEALDLDGLMEVLGRVERGEITFVARDTREPSPFAYELLNANPYAFLDGGEIQERRARMAATPRTITIESVRDLGKLDPGAIEQVVAEARPLVRDADELHDVLLSRILLPAGRVANPSVPLADEASSTDGTAWQAVLLDEMQDWRSLFESLVVAGRATEVRYGESRTGWVAAERWPAVLAMFPQSECRPRVNVPRGVQLEWDPIEARVSLLRGLMETAGPVTAAEIAGLTGITLSQADAALQSLEGEGVVLQGRFRGERSEVSGQRSAVSGQRSESPWVATHGHEQSNTTHHSPLTPSPIEWCHRRLLARIHRLTVSGLRREIEPVDVPAYLRFLFQYHGVDGTAPREGVNGLYEAIGQLQGLDVPAVAWEKHVLPQRVVGYRREWLDELCLTGEIGWGRLYPPPRDPDKGRPMASLTRVAPLSIYLREDLAWLLAGAKEADPATLGTTARQVIELLAQRGAMFATDLLTAAELVPAQLDDVLGELVARGVVTSDGFAGLRGLIRQTGSADAAAPSRRAARLVRRRRSAVTTGRWSLWRASVSVPSLDDREARREWVEHWAWQLLRRWGVMFRDLLARESGAPQWWELTQVYRRLEARGEIRGGRFVTGVGGEQYAAGEAVQALRALRSAAPAEESSGCHWLLASQCAAPVDSHSAEVSRETTSTRAPPRADKPPVAPGPWHPAAGEASPSIVVLSGADPLNLAGIITPDARVPSLASNRVVWVDGVLAADVQGADLTFVPTCPAHLHERIAQAVGLAETPLAATPAESVPSEGAHPNDEPQDRHAERFARRRRQPPERSKFPRPVIS